MPRSIRRAAHPIRTAKSAVRRAVVPKSIRKATYAARQITHPISAISYHAIERPLTAAIRGKSKIATKPPPRPVYRHDGCTINHRTAETAANCRKGIGYQPPIGRRAIPADEPWPAYGARAFTGPAVQSPTSALPVAPTPTHRAESATELRIAGWIAIVFGSIGLLFALLTTIVVPPVGIIIGLVFGGFLYVGLRLLRKAVATPPALP